MIALFLFQWQVLNNPNIDYGLTLCVNQLELIPGTNGSANDVSDNI